MTVATVRLEREGELASLVLDGPPLNLFGERTYEALAARLDEIESDPPRALVWRAAGDPFSGGVDVNEFAAVDPEAADEVFEGLLDAVGRIEALELPTLAIVRGLCLTAAFEVALACDLIVAEESSRFGLVERVVGLTPAGGGTQRLAARAGPGRAAELVMTGGLYGAPRLADWGVVDRVHPDGEGLERGLELARELASGPTRAHAATKRLIREQVERGVGAADELTPAVAGALFRTADLQSAVRSFLDEGPGKATFRGR